MYKSAGLSRVSFPLSHMVDVVYLSVKLDVVNIAFFTDGMFSMWTITDMVSISRNQWSEEN